MELRQLKYFVKAKELENFTEAASQLFISQSTLSQQVKQLEDELGIPLFDRVGKYIRVTEAGHLFYDYALECIQKANDGFQVLKDLGAVQAGHLVIGTTYGLRHILTPAIAKFSKRYPQVSMEIIFGTSKELMEGLENFKMDFVLTFEGRVDRKDLIYKLLFKSELGVIARRESALARKKSISLRELQELPLALPAKGFSTRKFINEVFEKHGISPKVDLEINDIPTLLELVEDGLWNTILTCTSISTHNHLVSIPIQSVKSYQQAAIISLSGVYEKKAATAFFEILLENPGSV